MSRLRSVTRPDNYGVWVDAMDIDLQPSSRKTQPQRPDVRDVSVAAVKSMSDDELDDLLDQWQVADDADELRDQATVDVDAHIHRYGVTVNSTRAQMIEERVLELFDVEQQTVGQVMLHHNSMMMTKHAQDRMLDTISNIQFQQAPSIMDRVQGFVSRHPIIAGFLGTDLLYRLHK